MCVFFICTSTIVCCIVCIVSIIDGKIIIVIVAPFSTVYKQLVYIYIYLYLYIQLLLNINLYIPFNMYVNIHYDVHPYIILYIT